MSKRTAEGVRRAYDDLVVVAECEDINDPNELKLGGTGNRLHRDRLQILPDLYAAELVLEEAKIRADELRNEARSAGMSEGLRWSVTDAATKEAER